MHLSKVNLMSTILLGLLIVILASVFQGSFAVPMSYARTWVWENSWMIFSVFGMMIFNFILAFLTVPQLLHVYGASTLSSLLIPIIFGVIWGIGAISFGLGVTAVGFALGYAIILGVVLGIGTFIPMAMLHPEEILTAKGILVLIGLLVALMGIGTSSYAGLKKEREQGKTAGEITKYSRYSVKTGIIICVVAGICSSAINIGFSISKPLIEIARSFGASETWAGNSIWLMLFTSGGILNILYCAYLMGINKTGRNFKAKGSFKNFLLLLLMSILWIGSFILYGAGATMMGSWGTIIGWSVYMVLSIAVANFWGIYQGEWKGTSHKTKMTMAKALGILLIAILVFAYSGTL